ncbi:MAG: AAC(3) family N-acetyltransferase [Pseudomonadota bacterium]
MYEPRTGNGREHDVMHRMLDALEVPADGTLLLHSSFKQLGLDGYDAVRTVEALVQRMQPGTLLLPTMSWRYVRPSSPVFSCTETPSNTGVLTEIFRSAYAQRRSVHPTHSMAACGTNTNYLLGEHHLSGTPCDRSSPTGRLADVDAWVVMLGIGMDCCTLIHHVEEMQAPDLYVNAAPDDVIYRCVDERGDEYCIELRRHQFLARDFWQYQDALAHRGQLGVFRCDNALAMGFRARDLVAVVEESLAVDPGAVLARPGARYRMM